jgi:serine/threonine protein kinase
MGSTHAAYDRIEDRFVCIKILHPRFDQRIALQEWLAMVSLEHPNLIRAYDVGEDGGRFYLVSELIQGETLDEMSKTIGPMAEGFVVEIARQLFAALAYAHEKRVIHRDIKPNNLMLSWDDAAPALKVVDFGVALIRERDAHSNITGEGAIAGTPLYMAPEQLRGEMLDASCDIYAAGVTLYHLLHGRLPYATPNLFAALNEIAARREGLRPSPGSVSPRLAALITRCTSGNRAERPSAVEALSLLDAVSPPLLPPAVVMPINPWLESPPGALGYPLGWGNGVGIVDETSERAVVERVQNTLWRLRLRLFDAAPGEFCTITQRCPARSLEGYTAILSGALSLHEAPSGSWAGLWGRVDSSEGEPLFFQNMHDQPVLPTSRAEVRELRFVIPPGAEWLNFGALLVGQGELMLGAISLVLLRPDGVQLAPLLLLSAGEPNQLT